MAHTQMFMTTWDSVCLLAKKQLYWVHLNRSSTLKVPPRPNSSLPMTPCHSYCRQTTFFKCKTSTTKKQCSIRITKVPSSLRRMIDCWVQSIQGTSTWDTSLLQIVLTTVISSWNTALWRKWLPIFWPNHCKVPPSSSSIKHWWIFHPDSHFTLHCRSVLEITQLSYFSIMLILHFCMDLTCPLICLNSNQLKDTSPMHSWSWKRYLQTIV